MIIIVIIVLFILLLLFIIDTDDIDIVVIGIAMYLVNIMVDIMQSGILINIILGFLQISL